MLAASISTVPWGGRSEATAVAGELRRFVSFAVAKVARSLFECSPDRADLRLKRTSYEVRWWRKRRPRLTPGSMPTAQAGHAACCEKLTPENASLRLFKIRAG